MDLDVVLADTQRLGARWSISLRRVADPEPFAQHRPYDLVRTASVAKIFVLMELASRLAGGTLDAAAPVDRNRVAPVHDSGLWHAMTSDALPVADVALLIGAVSDNWATNAAIDLCGLDAIQALAASLAPGGSMLHDYVRDVRSAADPASLSDGCADDWVEIMGQLYSARSPVLDWLARGADLSMVAGAFDLDPLAHDVPDLGVRLWNKTGTDAGVRADVGVVASATSVVSYAVLCNWPPTEVATRGPVLGTMRRIGDEVRAVVAGVGFEPT